MQPSRYQQAIFQAVERPGPNVIVGAVAGSGKTTTLLEAIARMTGSVTSCAFGKVNQLDLARKLAERGGTHAHARAQTIHSLGYSAVRRAFPRVRVDDGIGRERAARALGRDDAGSRRLRLLVERVSELAKLTLTEPTPSGIDSILERFALDIESVNGEMDELYRAVPEVLRLSREEAGAGIDFSDMIWLPNVLDLPVEASDWLLVDECQDLNAAQRGVVLRAARGGRVLAVGDRRQAIFGFAGADVESYDSLVKALSACEMPLSICYRCPVSHVELARLIVPQIEARPGAPDGEIITVGLDRALVLMRPGDLVISRINAPLAAIALELVRAGKRAEIKGRDIGRGLLALVDRRLSGRSLREGLADLVSYRDRECARLTRAEKGSQADALSDRVETILALADGAETVEELRSRIERVFSDGPSVQESVVLSSVHRAKGLEAQRVFILNPALLDWNRRGSPLWQIEQNRNLKYVALTRARQTLYFVE